MCVNPEDEGGMHDLSLFNDCNDPIYDKERVLSVILNICVQLIFNLMVHQTD